MVKLVALAAFCLAAASHAVALATAPRVVVVTDPALVLDSYSHFWASLRDRGYEVVFRSPSAAEPTLQEHDVLSFDHLVLFAPATKSFPADLSPQSLYSYVSRARNVLVVLSPDLSEYWRDFAREFDVEFDDRGNRVIDHFTYDTKLDDGTHSALVLPLADAPAPFITPATQAGPPLLYRGVGHEVGRQPLLSNILHARATAYSFDSKPDELLTEDAFIAGSAVGLVSAMQARNNARVTFVGSLDLFSDAFADAPVSSADGSTFPTSGNKAFIKDLTSWTFQESGVLRASGAALSRAIDGKSLSLYRVRDELDYSLEVSTLSPSGAWVPFSAPDFQFEFTMLDPHLRLPLSASPSGVLSARFRAPDRHGVFTLRVDYRRPGWTFLDEKLVVSVTPPRHDEYDRFITGAWPYYAGAFSVSAATLVFAVLWALQ